MNVIEPGHSYRVFTVKGEPVDLVFCHNKDGEFQDGLTSEEIIKVLVDRHKGFIEKADTTENLNVYTFLKQAQTWMSARRIKKYQRKRKFDK